MSCKYRVISVHFLDVYAKDDVEAMEIANNEYHSMDQYSKDAIRSISTAYDIEHGLGKDQLLSIGLDVDDSSNKFSPINEPF